MYLKNRMQFSSWEFFLEDPDGNEIRIPEKGKYASSIDQIFHMVMDQIDQFPEEYTDMIRFNAGKLTTPWRSYIKKVIEHQICIRNNRPDELCWNDGFGDKLHSLTKKIDVVIDHLPKFISSAAQMAVRAVTKAATGKSSPRIGGCATCGGTRTFNPGVQNLGRVGKLNVVLSRQEDARNRTGR